MTTSFVCAGEVRIYAESSVDHALNDIIKLYQQQYPSSKVTAVFEEEMSLTQHMQQSYGADIFISTNKASLHTLAQNNGINKNRPKYLTSNQLVAITSVNMDIPFGPSRHFNFAQAFKGYLCTADLNKSALGSFTKQSLNSLGWMSNLGSRIVENSDDQTLIDAVQNGKCDVGISYQTQALTSKKVKMMGIFPAKTHDPIDYYITLTKQGDNNKDANQFEKLLLNNAQVKALWLNYGFTYKRR
ncbi:molybdate ABC transporter substrate-binding protein [Acinetobacter ihumii]|uniref:molybdate ABC transporter substrate-binding protein n=1 Tax=Acinetobacter ihumii TaxID=2483802 RepID=UPI001D189772|nr:molybdate ABC transporter substrate-binding protein [Acinetobacter ihumii]